MLTPFFISDLSPPEQAVTLIEKIHQCCHVYDFGDPTASVRSKEIKRNCLEELVEYVAASRDILTENVYPEAVQMVVR